MPFYEYECQYCRAHTEVMQKISDKPLKKCPECGKSGLRKLISAPVFRLKGSGWYETDFKSDKESKRNLHGSDEAPATRDEGKAKPESKADAKADGKADAKPDAKPEAKSESRAAASSSAGTSRSKAAVRKAPARKAKSAVRKRSGR